MASQYNRAAGSYKPNRPTYGTPSLPSLTETEKSILKDGWGNEYKFLQSYGRKIYDDAERAEGREILKGYASATESFRNDRAEYKAESSSRDHNPTSLDTSGPRLTNHHRTEQEWTRSANNQRRYGEVTHWNDATDVSSIQRRADLQMSSNFGQELASNQDHGARFGQQAGLAHRLNDLSRHYSSHRPDDSFNGRESDYRSHDDNVGEYRNYSNGGHYDGHNGEHYGGHNAYDGYDCHEAYGDCDGTDGHGDDGFADSDGYGDDGGNDGGYDDNDVYGDDYDHNEY